MSSSPSSGNPPARSRGVGVFAVLITMAIVVALAVYLILPGTWIAAWFPSLMGRAIVATVLTVFAGIVIGGSLNLPPPATPEELKLVTAEEYAQQGLGPQPAAADPKQLYIDLMKRAVTDILYEDPPYSFYDDERQPIVADRFRLDRRVQGEDAPREAHTMVGIPRLNNLQRCVETILAENVPGDLLEAGVLRGGASIFLRSILKAHQVTDRKVIACDTFRPMQQAGRTFFQDMLLRVLSTVASIPSKKLQRSLYDLARKIPPEKRSFPIAETPSDEVIECTIFILRNLHRFAGQHKDQTGLNAVKSHFARYGLLDDQVTFLEGFFSDTLPTAPLGNLALIRLDGDLYESTRDAIEPLYPKLSPGGFCIIDDYYAFTDCQRAVDEYRTKHGITAEMHQIDKMAVYWRK